MTKKGNGNLSKPKSLLAEMIERRDKVFEELRDREPERVAKWTQLNAAISGIEAESTRVVKQGEYSGFRKPSEALFGYLDRVQGPQGKEEMCRALLDGGYGGGEGSHYWILIRTVNYQVKMKGLVERNGLIGKPGWREGLFLREEH